MYVSLEVSCRVALTEVTSVDILQPVDVIGGAAVKSLWTMCSMNCLVTQR